MAILINFILLQRGIPESTSFDDAFGGIVLLLIIFGFILLGIFELIGKLFKKNKNNKIENESKREQRIKDNTKLQQELFEQKKLEEVQRKDQEERNLNLILFRLKNQEVKRKLEEQKKKEKEEAQKVRWEKFKAEQEIIEKRRRENPNEDDLIFFKNCEIFKNFKSDPFYLKIKEEIENLEYRVSTSHSNLVKKCYQEAITQKKDEIKIFFESKGYIFPPTKEQKILEYFSRK